MTRTVAFATLGCRLNQVDTQEMQARLEARGFRTVPFEGPADVVVVNSCTVTSRADFSDRQMVRRAARQNPGARVVVTGCWAQTDPAAASATGADLVIGNADKHRIVELVEELLADTTGRRDGASRGRDGGPRVEVSPIAEVKTIPPAPLAPLRPRDAPSLPSDARPHGRSRAFVKVQEGCQHRCAFCIVPLARGMSRSQDPEVVLDLVRLLVDTGHPEVVLTGVDLGHYGADFTPRTTLAALLSRMVPIPGLRWVRLSSMLPAYFTNELMEIVTTSSVIAPHFHVPLQSGSDRVLRLMRRPYNVRMYRRVVERLAAAIPAMGLGADVIVGFPGETEADFEETRALIEDLPFSYLHVFGYSDRKGTEATHLPNRCDPHTVTRRSALLRALSREKNLAVRRRMVGEIVDVLVLETRDSMTGGLVGLAGNYVEVVFDGPGSSMGRVTRVRITGAAIDRTVGEIA